MDRIYYAARNASGAGRYVPQFYIAQQPGGGPPTQPGVTVLTVDGPIMIASLLGTDSLAQPMNFIDTPAPRERCIVLGARDNRIIL